MEVDDQQPLRDPLPRFEAGAAKDVGEHSRERRSEGMRLVSEDELKCERSFWSEKLQTDVMRLQSGCYERMQDLLSSHESRMKGEMRSILADRESERSDSVQGDSGGSREGAAALGTRMNLLEVKLASEQSKLGQQLEEVRTAVQLLGKELAEERKERQDIGQLAEMAVRTTRCLTEGIPEGGSSTAARVASAGPDADDSRIWEQLAGRISAVAQEIRSEVRSELLVALRTELTAEMARKVATFQARIAALESNLGGSVQKLLGDLCDRVGNLEAAQADATQVRERLLALEEKKGRASPSPQPQRQNYSGNRSMWPEVDDFSFGSSKVGMPMMMRSEAPKSRSASPLQGTYSSSDAKTQSRRNVYESDTRAQTSSGGEDSSTIVDADVSSVNDSHHEEPQAVNLMSNSLKSELEGLVSAVSSMIAPSEKPKNAGIPSRQQSTASTQRAPTQDRSLSETSRMAPKAMMRKPVRSPSPGDIAGTPKQAMRQPSVETSASISTELLQEATPRQLSQQPPAHGYARSASVQSNPKAGVQPQRVITPGVPASPDGRARDSRGPTLARYAGSHPSADANAHRPIGSPVQPSPSVSTAAGARSPLMVAPGHPASPLQTAGMPSPQTGYKNWR